MSNNPCLWQCPVCGQALISQAGGYCCENGHRYDRAKQGYVNLLLANQKNSRDPGDDANMVSARRKFLASGHYDFLLRAICRAVETYLPSATARVFDLGCGDGFYLHYLSERFTQLSLYGADISKHATKRAATLVPQAEICVASNYHLPIFSSSIDMALCVFAPLETSELTRVLKSGGYLIRVSPGADHLNEIKRALYASAERHQFPNVIGIDIESFRETQSKVLDRESLSNLLNMTPLNWRGDKEEKTKLLEQPSMSVTFDFIVQVSRFD